MKDERNDVVVGAFVLAGVAVLVAGALWLSNTRFGGEMRELSATFQNVGQLRPGNPVTVLGVGVGDVHAVDFGPDGGVEVVMRIEARTPLPPDPVVLLRPTSLFGQWEAAVVPAASVDTSLVAAAQALPPDRLPGVTQADFSQMSSYTEDIAENLQAITAQVERVFTDETVHNLERLVTNLERASRELADLVDHQREMFQGIAEDVSTTGTAVRQAAVRLDSTLARLESATAEGELDEIFENTRETTAAMRELTDEMRANSRSMELVLARADSTLTGTREFVDRLNRGEGALGRLARDTVLYETTVATLSQLRSLLEDLRRHPGRYFNFSIF